MNPSLWRNRRVLVTGHTGFKGSWLFKWLDLMGAEILGISLDPDGFSPYEKLKFSSHAKSLIMDLTSADGLEEAAAGFGPEVVFHLAAQALVGRAYERPLETFQSNVMGTAHLLDVLRRCPSLRAVVVVTSDKVYENLDTGKPFQEGDPLGGTEPYSASKACQEQVAAAYGTAYLLPHGVGIATARGSNVYGGGDYHYDRLIPGLIDGLLRGAPQAIRNPNAVRPWQYVLCLLEGYLRLAEELLERTPEQVEGWNFGPSLDQCVTVGRIVELLSGTAVFSGTPAFAEAKALCLDAEKSAGRLGWRVRIPLQEGLARTLEFCRRERGGEPTDDLMREELERYVQTCGAQL